MRQREKIGAFVRVPIDETYHTYGRIIRNYRYAFYDLKIDIEITDFDFIEKSPILFKLCVHKSAVNRGGWKIIGVKELSNELNEPIPFFVQEIGKPEICWIDIEGLRKKVGPSECFNLERLSVWNYDHVQQRLLDHYNNVPNNEVNFLKVNSPMSAKGHKPLS